ncbi:MAG TPA: flippase [Candidatus Bipolaricaulota bacterium]|nr:flippase [Candidatus Bipolaricaulota bacterium]
MSLTKQLARNTIVQFIGKIATTILGIFVVALMTRYLGPEGFGQYITVVAFLSFFGIIVDFGLSLTATRTVGNPGINIDKYLSNMLTLRVISAFIFLSLAPIVVLFFPYAMEIKLGVAIVVFSFFFISINNILASVFQKELKMFIYSIAEVIGRIVLLAGIATAMYFQANIYLIFWMISLGSFTHLLISYLASRKYVKIKFTFDKDVWLGILKKSWPIAISISCNLLYLKTDTVILSLYWPNADVGLYGAAYRVIDILTMLPALFMGLILPLLAKDWIEKKLDGVKHLLQISFDAMAMMALPVVLGGLVIGEKVMTLIAGSDFAGSGDILKILIFAAGAIFFGTLFGYAVVGVNKQKQMIWGYLATAIVALIGYFVFIPQYGYWAAAAFTVASEVMIMILTGIVVYRAVKFFPSLVNFGKSLVAAGIMAGVIYFLRDLNVIWLILIGMAVYFSLLAVFGVIKKETVKEMVSLKS